MEIFELKKKLEKCQSAKLYKGNYEIKYTFQSGKC